MTFIMTGLLYEFGLDIHSEVMLFNDGHKSNIEKADVLFREKEPSDDLSWKNPSEAGQYVLEMNVMSVADGGFLIHNNEPFAKSRCAGL